MSFYISPGDGEGTDSPRGAVLHTRYKCRAPTIIISSAEDAFLVLDGSESHWAGGPWPRVSQGPTQKLIALLRPSNYACAC